MAGGRQPAVKPTKPPSAYQLWKKETFGQISKQFPNLPRDEVNKRAMEMWKAVPDKSKWEEAANAAKADYDVKNAKWEKQWEKTQQRARVGPVASRTRSHFTAAGKKRKKSPAPSVGGKKKKKAAPSASKKRKAKAPLASKKRKKPAPSASKKRKSKAPMAGKKKKKAVPSAGKKRKAKAPLASKKKKKPAPSANKKRKAKAPAASKKKKPVAGRR